MDFAKDFVIDGPVELWCA